jgi:hypothetical protein
VFGFVPYTATTKALQNIIVNPLRVSSDLQIPEIVEADGKNVPYTIPLEKICLEDIPKVGGYV